MVRENVAEGRKQGAFLVLQGAAADQHRPRLQQAGAQARDDRRRLGWRNVKLQVSGD
jgi:hypothetical protein